jgi:hypothetical protein
MDFLTVLWKLVNFFDKNVILVDNIALSCKFRIGSFYPNYYCQKWSCWCSQRIKAGRTGHYGNERLTQIATINQTVYLSPQKFYDEIRYPCMLCFICLCC